MIEIDGKGCQVKVIADSVSPTGKRITTMQLRYWRAIHSEFMTHRVFSRNASSSRAIPVAKMIEQVRNDPAGPARGDGTGVRAHRGDLPRCTSGRRPGLTTAG